MFLFVTSSSRRTEDLLKLGEKARSNGHHSIALLSFDYALMFLFEEGSPDTALRMVDDLSMVSVIRTYGALIKAHCDEARTSYVLGIVKGHSDFYILLQDTLLYESAQAGKGHDVHVVAGTNGLAIKAPALLRLLRRTLGNHVQSRLSALGNICKNQQFLRPCISYCLSADCVDTKSCRWTHDHKRPHHCLDEQGIHHRIGFLCKVIIVYGIHHPNIKVNSIWEARYAPSYIWHVPDIALTICFPSPGWSGCTFSLTPYTSHSSRWVRPSCSTRSLYRSSRKLPGLWTPGLAKSCIPILPIRYRLPRCVREQHPALLY